MKHSSSWWLEVVAGSCWFILFVAAVLTAITLLWLVL